MTDGTVTGRLTSEHWSTLLRISGMLSRTLDLSVVLQTSIDSAVEVTGMDTGAIYLVSDETLDMRATTPALAADFPEELRYARLDEHPHIQRVLERGEPASSKNLSGMELSEAERAAVEARGLTSMLYVPLVSEDGAIGMFLVGSCGREVEMASPDIDLCKALSSVIALAVTNARLYELLLAANAKISRAYDDAVENRERLRAFANEMTLAEEHERHQIVLELQRRVELPLAALRERMQTARKLDEADAKVEYQHALRLVDEALDHTREITLSTGPALVFELGLVPALESLCAGLRSRGVSCEVFAEGDLTTLPEDVRIFAFQVARELLLNVGQHAHCRTVTFDVSRVEDTLRVRVTDDGRGFPTADLEPGGAAADSFGLFSLNERAVYLGGSMDIASSLGTGTTIVVCVPVGAADDDEVAAAV